MDASRYFTQAKHLEVYGIGYFFKEWGKNITVWTDLPVVPFIYGMIFKFFGESRLYIQIFTTFLFSLTVVLTYLIGKTVWDEDVGLFGGMLLLGIPYLLIQTPLMLVDVPTMFFLTLSIFSFIQGMKKGGAWMIMLSSIAIFLTFFSKYSTWLMLSVLVVIFLVHLISMPHAHNSELRTQNDVYRGSIIILIATLLIGVVFLYKSDVFSEQIKLLTSYQRPGLRRWGESFISTFFFQIHPFITIAALYSIYVAFKKKDVKYAIISWIVILIFLFQINRIRYIIMVFPMLALMASYGLSGIKSIKLRKFIAYCVVISSLVVAIFTYLPFLQKISTVNLKDAGKYLDSLDAENIEVFTLPPIKSVVNPAVSVPILDLFTEKRIYYDYNAVFSQTTEEIEKSPLRFTWEYKNPGYYYEGKLETKPKSTKVVTVISGEAEDNFPSSLEQKLKYYRMVKEFKTSNEMFRYDTRVKIYVLANRPYH